MLSGVNIVILGAGRVGYQLAKQLIEENRDVAIIEKDPDRAKAVSEALDCLVVNDINRPAALKQADIEKAAYFVAVTDSDEVNLITCGIVANEFNVPCKIARVRNIDFESAEESSQHSFLGIDYVVNPEAELTRAITAAIERGAVSDIMLFEESDMQMRSTRVERDSVLVNRTIQELRSFINGEFLVVVVLRGADYIIPTAQTVIKENDKLYLLATEPDFTNIFSQIGKVFSPMERIVVMGGGRMGQYVVDYLLKDHKDPHSAFGRLFRRLVPVGGKKNITIIDSDSKVCQTLADRYPKAMVINSDISDERFEEDVYLTKADLVVTTTDNQELNIVNAVYAKTLGTRRTVALVNRSNFVHVASHLGVDVAISPVDSMVGTILKHIRRSNVRQVHNITGSSIDIIELSVVENSGVVGTKIKDIRLPADSLIISVTRDGQNIIPSAELTIRSNDHLITITHKESIPKLEEIFTE